MIQSLPEVKNSRFVLVPLVLAKLPDTYKKNLVNEMTSLKALLATIPANNTHCSTQTFFMLSSACDEVDAGKIAYIDNFDIPLHHLLC